MICFCLQLICLPYPIYSTHQASSSSQTCFLTSHYTLHLLSPFLPCVLENHLSPFSMLWINIPIESFNLLKEISLCFPKTMQLYALLCVHPPCPVHIFWLNSTLLHLFAYLHVFPHSIGTVSSMDQGTHTTCIYILNTVPLICEDSMLNA